MYYDTSGYDIFNEEELTSENYYRKLKELLETACGLPHTEDDPEAANLQRDCEAVMTAMFEKIAASLNITTPLPPTQQSCDFKSAVLLHNPKLNQDACEDAQQLAYQTLLPVLLILCIIGNTMNLLVYTLPTFKGNPAVYFLRAKALTNLGFLLGLSLEILHSLLLIGTNRETVQHIRFEMVYWYSKPYVSGLINTCGTMATWFTLVITAETLLCVTRPFLFKRFTTLRRTYIAIAMVVVLSVALHAPYVATLGIGKNASISTSAASDGCPVVTEHYFTFTKADSLSQLYTTVQLRVQSAAVILIPNIAMLICTVFIVTNFRFKELGESFSKRRRCVLRLTVATTVLHLCLDGPQLFIIFIASVKGTAKEQHSVDFCLAHLAVNLLSTMNATAPFFVYLCCNAVFRSMTLAFLRNAFGYGRGDPAAQLVELNVTTYRRRDVQPSVADVDSRVPPSPNTGGGGRTMSLSAAAAGSTRTSGSLQTTAPLLPRQDQLLTPVCRDNGSLWTRTTVGEDDDDDRRGQYYLSTAASADRTFNRASM